MSTTLARLAKLSLATLFLISPMTVSSFLFPNQPSAANSALITPIPSSASKYQPAAPQESQFALLLAQNPSPQVLAAETEAVQVEKVTEEKGHPSSQSGAYTIAVLGDSMIDVMQPELPQLREALKKFYPSAQFELLNYGVGATNIEYGLSRLTSEYEYLGRHIPALLSQDPDVIVVESFAYNHWENNQAGLDRQWLALAEIVETIKSQSQAKIILAATIGPDETTLCDGIEGMQLPPEQKREKAQTIRAYLQNLTNFAGSQGYPLADAYHPSLNENDNGQPVYINVGDHLHPSGPGGELMAQKIAEAIWENRLF